MGAFIFAIVFIFFNLYLSQKFNTVRYYVTLGLMLLFVQVALLLPFFYFPFRPFCYKNVNATARLGILGAKLAGLTFEVKGLKNLLKGGGIVVINHQSFLDLVVLSYIWRHLGPAAVIAKRELMYFPLVGLSIWSYGTILIDRSSSESARKTLDKGSKAINYEHKKLIFFPEGTRSTTDTILPFKNGAFVTAFQNQSRIFPIVVSKIQYFDHEKKQCKLDHCQISILEPMESADYEHFQDLKGHCQKIMQTEYDRLNGKTVKNEMREIELLHDENAR